MRTAVRPNPTEPALPEAETDSRLPFEHVLELLLRHRENPSVEIERVLADHPQNLFGHCLRAAIIVRNDDSTARSKLTSSLTAIEAVRPNADDPARRHASAARAWLQGDLALAAERYDAIVMDFPRDILALVVAHAIDFRANRRRVMQDRIARVLPQWGVAVPGYASVLAMYAFALEENGQYRRAEEIARRALVLDPGHPAAIHVVAHVMEMQGRALEGLAFLAATEPAWLEGTGLSVHLAWHRALFHLDANDPESALAIYDSLIANTNSAEMSALADASALLWRLQLRDIRLSGRWGKLADRWERLTLDSTRPFYVVHAMMAFAAAGRTTAVARLLEALPYTDTNGTSLSLPEEAVARPFCEALLAFTRGDYAASVEWLERVRHIADRCGGSLAQCNLIHLTFTEATARARKGLDRAPVAELAASKPASQTKGLL